LDVVGQVVVHLGPGDGSTWRRGLALQVHGVTKSDSVLARLDFDVGTRARPDLDRVVSGSCGISGFELRSWIPFEDWTHKRVHKLHKDLRDIRLHI
jgi:hypothetical protein